MIKLVFWIASAIVSVIVMVVDEFRAATFELANAIPVPAFIQNISTQGLPDNTLYFMQLFQIDYGLSVVISAMLLKIVYRKILRLH